MFQAGTLRKQYAVVEHEDQRITIEVREHAKEAVVFKTGWVVEEVGLRKESSERQETINDTVRKTEVEVEAERGNIDQRQKQR